MSSQNLHNSLLRPPIIQILRASGFHSARPAVIDTLTDIAARYMLLLASSTVEHAENNHEDIPTPNPSDVLMALYDAGALRPQISPMEEQVQGEEDMRGLENLLGWFSGPVNKEIRRVAGFTASQGDVVDMDTLEKEDYLSALKKKHSKTGEESRFQGSVLGKQAESHKVVIEGGGPESIAAWSAELRSREPSRTLDSPQTSTISSAASMSPPEDMEI